jgi:DNA-binding CsgD family transcriptional regulator
MDIAIRHGLSPKELLTELGVTEGELRQGQSRRYPWDVYVEILERLATQLGGAENMPTAGEDVANVFPEAVALASAFVNPRVLCRFFNLVFASAMFPMCRITIDDGPNESLIHTIALLPGYRESEAFMYASMGSARMLPTAIGLPPARVEPLELTGARMTFRVDLPESRTLLARAKKSALGAFREQALKEMVRDKTELLESFAALQRTVSDLELREAALSEEIAARARLQSSLSKVLDTVSNAAFLVSGDSVTAANAAATAALESQGEALRTELTAAVREGKGPDLDLTPTGAPGQMLVIRRGLRDELARRLALAASKWGLTSRQKDVLKSLVDGLSNGDIAERLGCTARTVEVHVTSILERADAGSRLQLVAAFWGDL